MVQLSGAFLYLAGLALVPLLAMSAVIKTLVAIGWVALSGREWLAMRRGYARCGTLRIAAGGHVELRRPDGSLRPGTLCAGSVVLPRFAWLRVAPRGARPYAELVSAGSPGSEDWRRLQVIWRHIGAA